MLQIMWHRQQRIGASNRSPACMQWVKGSLMLFAMKMAAAGSQIFRIVLMREAHRDIYFNLVL